MCRSPQCRSPSVFLGARRGPREGAVLVLLPDQAGSGHYECRYLHLFQDGEENDDIEPASDKGGLLAIDEYKAKILNFEPKNGITY